MSCIVEISVGMGIRCELCRRPVRAFGRKLCTDCAEAMVRLAEACEEESACGASNPKRPAQDNHEKVLARAYRPIFF
jgi:hypothetical protein